MAVEIDAFHSPRRSVIQSLTVLPSTAAAVEKYLSAPRSLTVRELSVIRAYCVEWIENPLWDANPHSSAGWAAELRELRAAARRIYSPPSLAQWVIRANRFGLDPLL